jgi:pimeloyl-ACP methyl ester carboxylesterase
MTEFTDRNWTSRDGLNLHYRDYAGPEDKAPVLCLPGLTRNARDFESVAERIAGRRRVLCVDLRGRGDSDYARDSASYNPMQYVDDLNALFEQAGIARFVALGTSLGGLITMLLALTGRERITGALLNDIGPEIEADGLERIKGYVGQGRSFPTWMHAARSLEEGNRPVYPDYQIPDWLAMAKRLMTVGSNGRIVLDYDMKIAEPFAKADDGPAPDMWPALEALRGRPVVLLRGALSDILGEQTLAKMAVRLPEAEAVTVANVGHAPTLEEPESIAAIDRLLSRAG